MNILSYIHYNPVNARFNNCAEKYKFSDYHQYYGKIRNIVQVVIEKVNII